MIHLKSKIGSLILASLLFTSCAQWGHKSSKVNRYTASAEEFVPQTLAEIMAVHREELMSKGATVATLHTAEAILANNIPEAELREYLQQELSPKDFAKASKALDKGVESPEQLKKLTMSIGNGANFRGSSCYSIVNQAAMWGGSLAAIVFANNYFKNGNIIKSTKDGNLLYVQAQQQGILNLENQIVALKNEGVSPTSYLITTKEAEIANAKLAIEQSKVTAASEVAKQESEKTTNLTFAAVGAAAAAVSYMTCEGGRNSW